MRELALFAGAGGGILGGHLLGWRTVCAVEWAGYPRRVLLARQRDGILPRFPIWDDVQTFDGKPWRGRVDVVSGGFPCQDISAAGKGAGITGERSGMWSHMARIIGEVRPKFAFVENSPMLTIRGLGTVLGDLSEMGYDARWGVLGADDCGAPHKRDRIWIVANSSRWESRVAPEREGRQDPCGRGEESDVANSAIQRCGEERGFRRNESAKWARRRGEAGSASIEGFSHWINSKMGRPDEITELKRSDWWSVEPNVGRVVNGVASRVDRLKAIGNGQVPAVAATAFRILSERMTHEIERGER